MFNFVNIEIIIIIIFVIVIIQGFGSSFQKILVDDKRINILDKFREVAKNSGDKTAIFVKKKGEKDKWTGINYKDYYKYCRRFAGALQTLGLKEGDRVCLIGYNSFPLFVSIIGSMMAGCIPVPIYPDSGREMCERVCVQCEPTHLFIDNSTNQLPKFLELLYSDECTIRSITVLGDWPHDESVNASTYRWYELVNSVQKFDHVPIKEDHIATLIYTSGTSGEPKPVVITYKNLSAIHQSLLRRLQYTGMRDPLHIEMGKEKIISYLPITHIASQTIDLYLPIYLVATVYIAEPKMLQSKRKLGQTLREVRPTIFAGVPRVWEKIAESIEKKNKNLSYFDQLQNDLISSISSIPNMEIKRRVGLDRAKYCLTLGAPISQKTVETLKDVGIYLYDVYGLSETSGPITVSTPCLHKNGSVGKPLPEIQLKISKKKNDREGPIYVKGDSITLGYYRDPKSTQSVLTHNGWLNTGDVGYIDEDGFLFLTGREKDIIITSGGENVSPAPIEEKLVASIPIISQAIVVGDGKKYLTVLLVPKLEISQNGEPTIIFTKSAQKFLKSIGSNATTIIDVEDDEIVRKFIRERVNDVNGVAPSPSHQVKKWSLLPAPLTEKDQLLTSTLKIKRKLVEERYKDLVDAMYSETLRKKI